MTNTTPDINTTQNVKRLWRLAPILIALLIAVGIGHGLRRRAIARAQKPFIRQFMIFDTYGRLTFWAPESQANAAAKEIVDELEALQSVINTYDPDSEISRLNQRASAGPVACSDRLWNIINAGRAAYQITDGAFDISIGPLMKLWGFYGKRQALPTEAEIARADALTGLDKITFDPQKKTVQFPKQGMFLDFGGIAKGYALDICRDIAEKHGLSQGIIDLGGNLACLDKPPPGKTTYTIGIRNPAATDKVLETVNMAGLCVATSGNYERYFILDGKFIHHIIDPATGWPVPARASVSVIAPRGLTTDIFSTAIFVRGESLAKRLIQKQPLARVEIISAADSADPAAGSMAIQRFNWPAPGQKIEQ